MTIGLYARRKQWPLGEIEIRLRHARTHVQDCTDCMDKNVMLDHIETEVKLEGALSDEQRRRLIEIGEKCPVHRTLKSDIDISAKGVQSLR